MSATTIPLAVPVMIATPASGATSYQASISSLLAGAVV
jgi:hypothetical protein